MGILQKHRQLQTAAFMLVELIKGGPDQTPVIRRHDAGVLRSFRRRVQMDRNHTGGVALIPMPEPQPVDAKPAEHREGPDKGGRLGWIVVHGAMPKPDKGVLHDLFGLMPVTQHPARDPQQGRCPCIVELRQRRIIPFRHAGDEAHRVSLPIGNQPLGRRLIGIQGGG